LPFRRIIPLCLALLTVSAAPARAALEDYPSIKLQGLDKSVGRTVTFEAKVGSTIQYGTLFIKIQACRKAPPIEKPESAAFLQIWEVPPGAQKSEWVFSGWMFASSPALSAMDHPVYDVWVLDCTGREEPNEEAKSAETSQDADQTTLPPAGDNAAKPDTAEPIPTDSEAEPDVDNAPGATTKLTPDTPSNPDSADTQEEIPTDSEAEPEEQAPAPQPVAPVPQQEQTPQQQAAPADPYGNGTIDRNAPYSPPKTQEQPAVTPSDPSGEGIYSPSQGRVVPVQ